MRYALLKSVTVAVALTMSATAVTAVAAPAPDGGRDPGPGVQRERSVAGAPIGGKAADVPTLPDHVPDRATWPAAGKAQLTVGGEPAATGAPVRVAAGQAKAAVTVETMGRDAARKAGVDGVVLKVTDPTGKAGKSVTVDLDYEGFADAFGGGYGSRLTFSQYPACLLTTPDKPECRKGTPLKSTNDTREQKLTAEIPMPRSVGAPSSSSVVVASASAEGSSGNYSATDLAPSGSWSAGNSSGDFTYSIPLTTPTAPAGPAPKLSFAYSSGSLDGRTSATNNQASWVGDGWDLSAGGFIERSYTPCSDDPGNQGDTQVGDLCWKDLPDEELTVSLGGISGKFIKDKTTGALRPEKDDGSRIEKRTGATNGDDNGEHWKITTIDGTQYFLGLNRLPGWAAGKPETKSTFTMPVYGNNAGEPCHQAAFANSWCNQAYRWNVDLVIDPHGNAMVFHYDTEINHYKRAGYYGTNTSYVAAGRINRIEYGLRSAALYAPAPARVLFDTAERCLPSGAITCDPAQLTEANADHWPDVPFDRVCAAGEDCTLRFSPAFFTRKRLTKVRTQSLAGAAFQDVNSWTLRQQFPLTGDGSPESLWLAGVTHTGHVGGTAATPEVKFVGEAMHNRVDAIDNLLPLTRYRVTRVVGEAGAVTQVKYAEHDCVRGTRMPANPETNTMRCYPVYWSPPGAPDPILDWFHKHVVESITEDSVTGGPSKTYTRYDYLDGGAWHYDKNDDAEADERTWSLWRGFGRVKVLRGAEGTPRSVSETRYMRGMDEDVLPGGGKRDVWVTDADGGRTEDDDRLAGFQRETLLHSGGQIVSATVNDPVLIESANDGDESAYMVRTKETETRSRQEDGQWRRTRSVTSYNALGLPTQIDVAGDVAVSGDESCSQTGYLRNDAAWMLAYASTVRSIAKPCSAWPGTEDDVVSDVRSYYDGQAHGAAPNRGVVTKSERWTGGTQYQTVSTVKVDAYGRTIESTDADGGVTASAYEPATGVPSTVTVTNPNGWVTKTIRDTARGLPLTEIGINGERSDLAYDPLGRLVAVWQPGRDKAAGKSATVQYAYDYRTDAPTVVTSKSLREDETYAVSYDLYDGLLRPRQSQIAAIGNGRLISETFYDSRGNAVKSNAGFYNTEPPSSALFGVADEKLIPNQTVTEFDDVGRPLETILRSYGDELWRTKARYGGDNTYTTPPQGGIATAVIKDANGAIVQRREFHQPSADGTYGATAAHDATSFTYNAKGVLSKAVDAQGNAWTYEYDKLGRKSADNDPDRGRTTYAYDLLDQMVSTTDARGKTLAYAYDALGRKTAVHEGSLTGTKLSSWTYDTLRKGLLTSSTRYANGNAYTQRVDAYDTLNRPVRSSVVIPAAEGKLAGTYTFRSSYSAVTGQLLSETLPAAGGLPAENVIHKYNSMGLPESTYGLNTYASEHQYSPFGETLRVTLGVSPNKVWINNTYAEGSRRLTNMLVTRDTSTQREVTNRTLTYDPAGSVHRISDKPASGPSDTQCFDYDHLQRMTSAWTPATADCTTAKSVAGLGGSAPYWHDFTFDKIGNRTSKVTHAAAGATTETYEIPASGPSSVRPHAVNAVERVGPNGTARDEFTYDATGNTATRRIAGNTQTLEWNSEGRMAKATEADGKTSQYIYGADGSRLIKKEPTGATLYLPGHEVIALTAATTTSGKRYYTHGGATVAMRSSVAGLQYMVGDHHGTDDVAVSASNLYVTRRYSDPFGAPRGTAPRFWPDDKGFVGGVKDSTGLTSIGAREYDPATGRFISVDPIMDMGGGQLLHAYAYSNNNPATFSDPSGLRIAGCEQYHMACGGSGGYLEFDDPDTQAVHDEVAKRAVEQNNGGHRTQESQDEAAREMGMSPEEVARLQEESASDKGFWGVMKEELPDIIGDLTGLNDIRDCFTSFDLWACAGLIPWAKVLKLVSAVGKVFNAVRKALKWEERVSAARAKLHRLHQRTMQLVRKGEDDLAALEKKHAGGASCPIKHSFPPGTRVLMADGTTKPIENVKLGDVVRATDPEKNRTESRPVVATWTHNNEPQRTEITVDTDGVRGAATAKFSATDWHPVWVADAQDWLPVGSIQVGQWLRTESGTLTQAVAVRKTTETGAVYDLTVNEIHAYYVQAGNTSVLVHNCGDLDAKSAAGDVPAKGGRKAAGRAYQKHMDRGELPEVPGSQLDIAGKDLLDEILTDPHSDFQGILKGPVKGGTRVISNRIMTISGPNGPEDKFVGAVFNSAGSLRYFGMFS